MYKRISDVSLSIKPPLNPTSKMCMNYIFYILFIMIPLLGWGSIQHPGPSHHTLQQAMLPVVSYTNCFNRRDMVCTGFGRSSLTNACRGGQWGTFCVPKKWRKLGVSMELPVLWLNIASTIQHLHLLGITLTGSNNTSDHIEVEKELGHFDWFLANHVPLFKLLSELQLNKFFQMESFSLPCIICNHLN